MISSTVPSLDFAADTTPRARSTLKGNMIRLIAAVQTRKNPFFHEEQTDWCYTDSGPPETKIITARLAAWLFLPMPPPEHAPFSEGPVPDEGTTRVSGEPSSRKASARTSPKGSGLRPSALGTPRGEHAEFRVPAP